MLHICLEVKEQPMAALVLHVNSDEQEKGRALTSTDPTLRHLRV
jgi:hypothetical protein